jgi:2-polyprenyl-3-methyl-5-hydroxy-6-metoxy-1,4-benzoquinol methylase
MTAMTDFDTWLANNDARICRHTLGYLEAADKPDPEALKEYYARQYFQQSKGNYRAHYSEKEKRFIESKIRQRAAVVNGLHPGKAKGCMLDVGCGEGFALNYFRKDGWQVTGLDYSDAGMKTMNPECLDALQTGDLITLLKTQIDSGDRYELVWCTNVLEHVIDPPALLTSLRQLVSDDGILVVTVPNDFSQLQQYLINGEFVGEPYWIALPDHLAYFDRDSLESIAAATGWSTHVVLADFPIEWFLLNTSSNYFQDRSLGSLAHNARVELENLLDGQPLEKVNRFFAALADVGMGRNLTAFLSPGNAV